MQERCGCIYPDALSDRVDSFDKLIPISAIYKRLRELRESIFVNAICVTVAGMTPEEPLDGSVKAKLLSFNRALNVHELAEILNTPRPTIYAYTRSKVLSSFRVGNNISFDPKEVVDWLAL